jgi:methionyl-tRNA formyltransferase
MKVQILVDNINSWYVPYALILKDKLKDSVDSVSVIHNHSDVVKGDILCLIGCEKLFRSLNLNKSNIVVHESWLPKGKGWSPLSWQVIEGENDIPITLFEADIGVDAGEIYLQECIKLSGHELNNEIKHKQGVITNSLIEKYILCYPNLKGKKQNGESTFYKKRSPKDSEIDINKSINEQFNLLRVVDNVNYPAYFIKNNIKYILKIYKEDGSPI